MNAANPKSFPNPGHEGADPLVVYELRDIDGKGKRDTQSRSQRVDILLSLKLQGKIEDYQFAAGRRFQKDVETAELRTRSTLEATGGRTGHFGIADSILTAMESASKARTAASRALGVVDKGCANFLCAVLLEGVAPTKATRVIRGWTPHMGLPILRIGLSALAAHYEGR